MITQLKINKLDTTYTHSDGETKTQRANIDHLVKKIMTERRRKKKISLISLSVVLLTFAIVSFIFTTS